MKSAPIAWVFCCTMFLTPSYSISQQQQNSISQSQQRPEELAEQAAYAWLHVIDSANYADSWQEAAKSFRKSVTRKDWQGQMDAERAPLGKVISRTLDNATSLSSLPGAPAGQYVVVQYRTSFEHKKSAVETVACILDKDGKWRPAGYHII
jgi:hypothetical protein